MFRRRSMVIFLAAVVLFSSLYSFPALALRGDYNLTPAPVSIYTVQEKLISLNYMTADQAGLDVVSLVATNDALRRFQEDNNLDEFGDMAKGSDPMDRRTLIRLMSAGVPVVNAVYIPVYGGKCYHTKADACRMKNPEKVDISVAVLLGFTPCANCYK